MSSQQNDDDLERRKTEAEVKLLEDQIEKNANKQGCGVGCFAGGMTGIILLVVSGSVGLQSDFLTTLIVVVSIIIALVVYAKVSNSAKK